MIAGLGQDPLEQKNLKVSQLDHGWGITRPPDPHGGHQMISQVEHVARALYAAETDDDSWDDAPESVEEAFRQSGCDALMLNILLQQQGMAEPPGSMPDHGLPAAQYPSVTFAVRN